MAVVIVGDLLAGNRQRGVRAVIIRSHYVFDVGDNVVLGEGPLHLDRVNHVALCEQRTVLVVELLGVDRVLEVVPVGAVYAGLVQVDALDKVDQVVLGEGAGLVEEDLVLGQQRRDVLAGGEIYHLVLADGNAGRGRVLDEHMLVQQALPGRIADLLVGLLVLGGGAGQEFVDLGVPVDLLLEVRIRNAFAGDLAYVIFLGSGLESRLQRTGIDNKRE